MERLDKSKLPNHIAIIMDGNGRWAKTRGKERIFGHRNGVTAVRETVEACAEIGIPFLTLYAFSSENWDRPSHEVEALMELLVDSLVQELSNMQKNSIKLNVIGNLKSLPEAVYNKLSGVLELTKSNTRLTLTLALSYSSHWEITEAVKQISRKVKKGELEVESICEQTVSEHLMTNNLPDPELLIRTSGEQRISNYLLWQKAYTELYFTKILWPDFNKESLIMAILEFQNRERRFGKTSEQIQHIK